MNATPRLPLHATDLRGAARLAVHGVQSVVDVVESMHGTISRAPWKFRAPPATRTRGLTALVYRSVREITALVGDTLDGALQLFEPLLAAVADEAGSEARDALVAALNGVVGDHLSATGNPLATPMTLCADGQPLPSSAPGGRVLLLIHGLCMNDRQWRRQRHDHGAALAQALGYRAVYLRYNSGRHVSDNGRELATLLEQHYATADTELAIIGYSMGGLLARSACHFAAQTGHGWLSRLQRLVFLGTPHFGAPMERGGNWLQLTVSRSAYAAPLAGLGRLRSAGVTDLRHGNLLHEDWQGVDRFAAGARRPRPVPLPAGVSCTALAASRSRHPDDGHAASLGDGLVPVDSALGRSRDPARTLDLPPERQWIGYGMNHLDLLSRDDVCQRLAQALSD